MQDGPIRAQDQSAVPGERVIDKPDLEMKVKFKQASCRVEMDYFLKGSVLKGTIESGCTETRLVFRVDTDEPNLERVSLLIRNAKRGCFAESMIRDSVPVKSTVEVNGVARAIAGITE